MFGESGTGRAGHQKADHHKARMARHKEPAAFVAEINRLTAAGSFADGYALSVDALAEYPANDELEFARAAVLFDWGRLREARSAFLQLHARGACAPAVQINLAWICRAMGLTTEACAFAEDAARIDTTLPAAHIALGTVLQALKEWNRAIEAFRRVLDLEPHQHESIANIGHCEFELGNYDAAEAAARRAIELAPERALYRAYLGMALLLQDRIPEARDAFHRARDIEAKAPLDADATLHSTYGLMRIGDYQAVIELCRARLPHQPDPNAHVHYAFALLTLGCYPEGWQQYEFRWTQSPLLASRPPFVQPTWIGQALAGKTVLVRGEQGAGDSFQFTRFTAVLKERGATVLWQGQQGVAGIARAFDGVDAVVGASDPVPDFDFHASLMSLPSALALDVTGIPSAIPYIRVDSRRADRWHARWNGSNPSVGLVWSGNPAHHRDRHRSMSLAALRPLWDIESVHFVSLQKPVRPEDLVHWPANDRLIRVEDQLTSFEETAAAIASLDLVICVDTAVAHLAGALGAAVWVLLPEVGDFRWFDEGQDSPWYPTMRLFRQRKLGDWSDVIARVAHALAAPTLRTDIATLRERSTVACALPRGATASAAISGVIARVREARHGIIQYLPNGSREAAALEACGEYLEGELAVLVTLMPPDAQVLVAGAGIGTHAVPIARSMTSAGHLLLHEADPIRKRLLRQNLSAQRELMKVSILSGSLVPSAGASDASCEVLDKLGLDRLDALKIDDPCAADVLLGSSRRTIAHLRPVVLAAAEDRSAVHKLAEHVKGLRYRCYTVVTPFASDDNFYGVVVPTELTECRIALLGVPEEMTLSIPMEGCVPLDADAVEAVPDRRPSTVTRLLQRLRRSGNRETAIRQTVRRTKDMRQPIAESARLAGESQQDGAAAIVSALLDRNPGNSELLMARGAALYGQDRVYEAYEDLSAAVRSGLRDPLLFQWLARSCLRLGRAGESGAWAWRAKAARADAGSTLVLLAQSLAAQGNHTEAGYWSKKALGVDGLDDDALLGAAQCSLDASDVKTAEAAVRRTMKAVRASTLTMLGAVLLRSGRKAEAADAFQQALRAPDADQAPASAFVNLAIGFSEQGRVHDALQLYESHLPRIPDAYGYFVYGMALLRTGRFAEGWKALEFRWLTPRFLAQRPPDGLPRWRGQDLGGRSVLLRSEQGLGDSIQFIRYAELLARLGAKVIVQAHEDVAALMRTASGVAHVLEPSEIVPKCDFAVPMMSLPHAFGTELSTVPATVPYLQVPRERSGSWADELSSQSSRRIGIVWAGNPKHERDRERSIPFAALKPLFADRDSTFYSLQKGSAAADCVTEMASCSVVDLAPRLVDFVETAAAIAQLDLVVSVDTAVAHIAGALGKPVWLMLPHVADFRWLEGRTDSPWYPTMRIFRQSVPGAWSDVIASVADALAGFAPTAPGRHSDKAPVDSLKVNDPTRPREASDNGHKLAAVAVTCVGTLAYLPQGTTRGPSLERYGEWLQPELDLLCTVLHAGATVAIASPGEGVHAIGLGRAIGSSGHVMLFEPRQVERRLLVQNLATNGIGHATVLKESLADLGSNLDRLAPRRLDLVKFENGGDVESVLEGGSSTLWRLRPHVFATAADEQQLARNAACVRKFGYRVFKVTTPLYRPDNFNRRVRDVFEGAVALAVLAAPEELALRFDASGLVELTTDTVHGQI